MIPVLGQRVEKGALPPFFVFGGLLYCHGLAIGI